MLESDSNQENVFNINIYFQFTINLKNAQQLFHDRAFDTK